MTPSFNVATEGFIPCIDSRGQTRLLSLRDTLVNAHELRELHDDSPLVTVALHRLLLTVLHRCFGPDGLKAWETLWKQRRFQAANVDPYLKEWHPRFELFDAKTPFYQDAGLSCDDPDELTPITKMTPEWASGNNPTLFDHSFEHLPRAVPVSTAARWLVSYQCWAIGGGVSKPFNFKHAPLIGRCVVMPLGDNLWSTLMLNLIEYGPDTPMPAKRDGPVWELDKPPKPEKSGTRPRGFLDYLTWQSRRVRICPPDGTQPHTVTGCRIQQGMCLPEDGVRDPAAAFAADEKLGWKPVRVSEHRATWRDSHAILAVRHDDHPSKLIRWLQTLERRGVLSRVPLRLTVTGLCSDKAKVILARRDILPLPTQYLHDESLVAHLAEAIERANRVAAAVMTAARVFASEATSPSKTPDKTKVAAIVDSLQIQPRYWAGVEPRFMRFMVELAQAKGDQLDLLQRWLEELSTLARSLFRSMANDVVSDARSLRALVSAERRLLVTLAGLRRDLSLETVHVDNK